PAAEWELERSRSTHPPSRESGNRSRTTRRRRSAAAFRLHAVSRLWQTKSGPGTYQKICVSCAVAGRVRRYERRYRRTCLDNDRDTLKHTAGFLNPPCGDRQTSCADGVASRDCAFPEVRRCSENPFHERTSPDAH